MENNQIAMNKIKECLPESFDKFLDSVDKELGRDETSLHLFEWVIEERYHKMIETGLEYFSERPDMMAIQKEEILFELNMLLSHFESIEEYEKCDRILKIKQDIEYNK